MDKKIAGLLGGVAAVATMASAQAATGPAPTTPQALQASSYADLLAPISNAAELLKADDAARGPQPAPAKDDLQVAQVYYAPYPPPYASYRHHHHHHHHHSYYRRYSHHHHHHHHGVVVGVPGVGGVVVR
jgi:hypothetical protein